MSNRKKAVMLLVSIAAVFALSGNVFAAALQVSQQSILAPAVVSASLMEQAFHEAETLAVPGLNNGAATRGPSCWLCGVGTSTGEELTQLVDQYTQGWHYISYQTYLVCSAGPHLLTMTSSICCNNLNHSIR